MNTLHFTAAAITALIRWMLRVLARLATSLLVALIVALLAVVYLNTSGSRRERVARALLWALGEPVEAAPQPMGVDENRPAHWRLAAEE